MEIWIVNQFAVNSKQAGITRHFHLARRLAENGIRVTILASSFDHFDRKGSRLENNEEYRLEEVEGVRFLWLKIPPYSTRFVSRFLGMIRFARQVSRAPQLTQLPKPDLILASTPNLFAARSAQKLAKKFRIPFLFELRDVWPQSIVDLGGVNPKNPVIQYLERLAKKLYRSSARLVTSLPSVQPYLEKQGIPASKIIYIPNFVDFREIPEAKVPAASSVFTVMYAGAHGIANDLSHVIHAAKILKERDLESKILFRFVGEGPQKQKLIELAQSLELSNVRFDDGVAKEKIYPILTEADAFLMPLRRADVFKNGISPNKLFDYMAMARPVIFNVDTSPNFIEECRGGPTVEPQNAQALADAVVKLSEMPAAEREEMGARCRRYVQEKHNVEVLAKKLANEMRAVKPRAVNLHITHSSFKHANRILKETETICESGHVSECLISAIRDTGQADFEKIDSKRSVFRLELTTRKIPWRRVSRILTLFEWYIKAIVRSWNEPLVLINAHSLQTLPIAVVLKWASGAKLIYTPHELETEKGGLTPWSKPLARKLEKFCTRFVDSTIVVSPSIQKWYENNYQLTPISTVRNIPAAKLHSHFDRSGRLRKNLGIPADAFVLLYQGSLAKGRGLEIMLEGVKKNTRGFHMVFMGFGPLQEWIQDESISSSLIHFHPAVASSELEEFSRDADIGLSLLPNSCLNHYYCLPNKLFEYIASGIPVLASRFVEMKNILDRYQCGWTIDPDLKSFEEFLETLLPDDIRAKRMAAEAASRVLTWENEVKNLEKAIQSAFQSSEVRAQ